MSPVTRKDFVLPELASLYLERSQKMKTIHAFLCPLSDMIVSLFPLSLFLVYSARKHALDTAVSLYNGSERLKKCTFGFSVDEFNAFIQRFTLSIDPLRKHICDVCARDFSSENTEVFLVCDGQLFNFFSLWNSHHVICVTDNVKSLRIPSDCTMDKSVHVCTPDEVPEMDDVFWDISPFDALHAMDSENSEERVKELFIPPEVIPFYCSKSGSLPPELPGSIPLHPLEEYKGNREDACALLVSTGSLCPVHRMHIRIFDVAALYLKRVHGISTVGAYISPSSDCYVGGKLTDKALSFSVRALMCEKACEDHNKDPKRHPECSFPVCTSTWEGQQARYVSFECVRDHIGQVAREKHPEYKQLHVFFVCGFDHYLKTRLYNMREVVSISRQPYVPEKGWLEEREDTMKQNKSYVFLEDSDEELKGMLSDISSTEIRGRVESGESLDSIMFPSTIDIFKKAWTGVDS